MKQVNTKGGSCERCGLYVCTGRGWLVKIVGVGHALYHNSCWNSKVEDEKNKLKQALKKINPSED